MANGAAEWATRSRLSAMVLASGAIAAVAHGGGAEVVSYTCTVCRIGSAAADLLGTCTAGDNADAAMMLDTCIVGDTAAALRARRSCDAAAAMLTGGSADATLILICDIPPASAAAAAAGPPPAAWASSSGSKGHVSGKGEWGLIAWAARENPSAWAPEVCPLPHISVLSLPRTCSPESLVCC